MFHPETWGKMNPFWRSYSSDGLGNQAPTRKQLENDWYKIQLYDIKAVARAYIPNTTWTMEWRAAHELPNLSNKKYEEYIMTADPDKCRNNSDDETPSRHFGPRIFLCNVFFLLALFCFC